MEKIKPKNRARIEILNYIICFSTFKSYGNGHYSSPFDESKTFKGGMSMTDTPPIGSLCKLTAAPFSKYYLSWLIEHRKESGWDKYLLESIEDGSLCWWSNVGVEYYNSETVADYPQWRWSDKQYEFNDRWHRICKRMDAYIVLPCNAYFGDGFKVTLSTRIRFGLSDEHSYKTFDDWRKVTVKEMKEFYQFAMQEHDNRPKGKLPSIHEMNKTT